MKDDIEVHCNCHVKVPCSLLWLRPRRLRLRHQWTGSGAPGAVGEIASRNQTRLVSRLGPEPASVRSLREEEAGVPVHFMPVSTAIMQEGPSALSQEDTRIKPSEGKRKIWYFVLFNPNIDSINWLTIKCVQKSLVRTESD